MELHTYCILCGLILQLQNSQVHRLKHVESNKLFGLLDLLFLLKKQQQTETLTITTAITNRTNVITVPAIAPGKCGVTPAVRLENHNTQYLESATLIIMHMCSGTCQMWSEHNQYN